MSITSITIENFKGIRDKVKIDLKPITLLFGPNSAGKSTIIQALHYAWEVIGRHNLDPNFTEFGGREMDLGGFKNMVYGHDLSRSISIRLDMDLMGEPLPIYGDPEALMYAQSEYAADDRADAGPEEIPLFRWNIGKNKNLNAWIEFQVSWSESTAKFQVSSYEVGFNNEMISKIKTAPDSGNANIAYINFFHPLLLIKNDEIEPDNNWLNNLISTYAKQPEIWLDEKYFSSDQYKEYFSLLEEPSKPYDAPDNNKNVTESKANDLLEKMTDEELHLLAKNYGYSNKMIKVWERDTLIAIIEATKYNEKNKPNTSKSLKNMSIAELKEMAEPYDFDWKDVEKLPRGYFRSYLMSLLNLKQYNERREKEKIKPLLPYEFLFICINVFSIDSINKDLNIECGLIDALPKKEGTFELNIKAKVSDDKWDNSYCSNALDSAIKQFILGPLDVLRVELKKLHYLGPIRSRIPRNYIPNRYIENRNWPDGLAAWDVLHKGEEAIVNQTDHWLADRLKSGYHVTRKSYKEIDVSKGKVQAKNIAKQYKSAPTKTRLYLMDQKSGVEVQPPDVGVGISQVIPVIVSALYFRDGIVTIEQPELHIHPALQVTLGDLFISQIHEKGPCFILETHSEHLLLRIMRRIRETSNGKLPDGISPISPEDVNVLFVEAHESHTIVREMPLNKKGELIKAWPGGFFEEDFGELF